MPTLLQRVISDLNGAGINTVPASGQTPPRRAEAVVAQIDHDTILVHLTALRPPKPTETSFNAWRAASMEAAMVLTEMLNEKGLAVSSMVEPCNGRMVHGLGFVLVREAA